MRFVRRSDEVYYTTSEITTVSAGDVAFLKTQAAANPRRRVRLCAHRDVSDPLHEMLIVHMKGAYVRPHKHVGKSESFHMVEGRLKVFLFDDEGRRTATIELSQPGDATPFFYRLDASLFHSVSPETEVVVFHEVTNGPFDRAATVFASWAPPEDDIAGQAAFLRSLASQDVPVDGMGM